MSDGEVDHRAVLRGRCVAASSTRSTDVPVVGDWVAIRHDRRPAIIEAVPARRSAFVRQRAGSRSVRRSSPRTSTSRSSRRPSSAISTRADWSDTSPSRGRAGHCPLVLLTKADLVTADELEAAHVHRARRGARRRGARAVDAHRGRTRRARTVARAGDAPPSSSDRAAWASPRWSTRCSVRRGSATAYGASPTDAAGTPRPTGSWSGSRAVRCSSTRQECASSSCGATAKGSSHRSPTSRRLPPNADSAIARTAANRDAPSARRSMRARSIAIDSRATSSYAASSSATRG